MDECLKYVKKNIEPLAIYIRKNSFYKYKDLLELISKEEVKPYYIIDDKNKKFNHDYVEDLAYINILSNKLSYFRFFTDLYEELYLLADSEYLLKKHKYLYLTYNEHVRFINTFSSGFIDLKKDTKLWNIYLTRMITYIKVHHYIYKYVEEYV